MLLPQNVFEALMHFRKSVFQHLAKENMKSNPMTNSVMDEIFKTLSIFSLLITLLYYEM